MSIGVSAWNQINGYDYHWFNVYSTGDIVYYENAVYSAIKRLPTNNPTCPDRAQFGNCTNRYDFACEGLMGYPNHNILRIVSSLERDNDHLLVVTTLLLESIKPRSLESLETLK